MRLRDAERLHEGSNIVGEKLRGIDAFRFVGFASPSEVERDAGKVLGVFRHLKSVTGMIGGQVGNENEWLACSLLVIVHGDVVCFDLRHGIPPSERGFLSRIRTSSSDAPRCSLCLRPTSAFAARGTGEDAIVPIHCAYQSECADQRAHERHRVEVH